MLILFTYYFPFTDTAVYIQNRLHPTTPLEVNIGTGLQNLPSVT